MHRQLSLDGDWQLAHCPDGQGSIERLEDLQWLAARVPGEVHWDLLRAGRIADPFYDLNHLQMRWLEGHEFWYRRSFEVPEDVASAERLELEFEGLDCFATVWINGRLVGRCENALVPQRLDVTGAVQAGRNEIVVRLASPLRAVEGRDISGCGAGYGTVERLWARKSDQCYGWDIALRLVTVGIWRPVRLHAYSGAILRDFYFRTVDVAADGSWAKVALEVEVEALSAAEGELSVRAAASCGESRIELEGPVEGGRFFAEASVERPALWWPWDAGEPNLYDLEVQLLRGGEVIDSKQARVGIRTVRLVQEPEGARERSFAFEINGRRVFCRGLNWTPCDAIYPRAEPEKQIKLTEFARYLNCNMLRVWGGGIYEPDEFYEQCDRLGIMIFHDFMFACAVYPQSEEFLEIVRREAEAAVRRLRNHPSIVLWSGDNEVDCAYEWFNAGNPWRENKISRVVLPGVLERLDPSRPYIPSSPFSPDPSLPPQDPLQGDQHIWHHGTPFWADVYMRSQARFPSEIGHLSCPNLETVEAMLAPENRWPPDNRAWDEHFGSLYDWNFFPKRREKMEQAIEAWLGQVPDDLETYIVASQLLQAEAYKCWAEYFRLRKDGWRSGGILLWNLADCWPQFSDAIVDYFLRPKLACNLVRLAYKPVHICFSPPVPIWGDGQGGGGCGDASGEASQGGAGASGQQGAGGKQGHAASGGAGTQGAVRLCAINDTQRPVAVRWQVEAIDAAGGRIGQALEGEAELAPNCVAELADVGELVELAKRARGKVLARMWATESGELLSANYFRPWRPRIRDIPALVADIPPLGWSF